MVSSPIRISSTLVIAITHFSDAPQASAIARGRLSSVLLSVDEQPVDTRTSTLLHDPAMGHVSGRVGWVRSVPVVRVRCIFASLARATLARR